MSLVSSPLLAGVQGEVVAWDVSAINVSHGRVVLALRDNGLDESLARSFAPRNAFCRACRRLAQRRIVRVVSDTPDYMSFQFTAEHRDQSAGEERLRYDFEALLSLDKAAGVVKCKDAGLAAIAQTALDNAMEGRTPSDITDIVQRIFRRTADLFPIRRQGGCYFVPARHQALVEQVDRFLAAVGGDLRRMPIVGGTEHGDKAIRETVTSGLEAMIEKHRLNVASFDQETLNNTFDRAAARIRETEFKIQCYREFLGAQAERLDAELAEARRLLREKVEALAAVESTETAA